MALEVVSAGRLDRRRMYYPRVLTMATRPDGTARADQQRIRSQLDLFWRRLLSVVFALAHLICFFFYSTICEGRDLIYTNVSARFDISSELCL